MLKLKHRIVIFSGIILISGVISGCGGVNLNPYAIQDETPYYKDVGSNEDEDSDLKYKEVYEGEDGAKTAITRKTIELPDKRKQLEGDSSYKELLNLIEDTEVQVDGDEVDTVYNASYSDFNGQNITSLITTPDEKLVISNINYTGLGTLKMTVKNVSEDMEEIDITKVGLTIFFYDASASTISVWQPKEEFTVVSDGTVLNVGDSTEVSITLPIFNYVKYMAIVCTDKHYEDYFSNLKKYINNNKTDSDNEKVIDDVMLH